MRTIQVARLCELFRWPEYANYSGGQSMQTIQVDRVCEVFRWPEYAKYSGGKSVRTIQVGRTCEVKKSSSRYPMFSQNKVLIKYHFV
jgi:hypothetical protein